MANPTSVNFRRRGATMIGVCPRYAASSDGSERWRAKQMRRNTFEQLADTRHGPSQASGKCKYRWKQIGTALSEVVEVAALRSEL